MNKRKAAFVYLSVAFITFGVAASDPNSNMPGNGVDEKADRAMNGLFSGAAWPLYWVWALADGVRK